MALSHRRQTALLNLGLFCPRVIFWVGRVSQKAGKSNGRQGAGLLIKAGFLANIMNYDLSATKTSQQLESSLTSGGFSEALDGNQKILHLH